MIFSTIEEAVEDIREGKFVIVVDDEDRENEGDFITAAELITPEKVNFMLHYGRGVLCAPITLERCRELKLPHPSWPISIIWLPKANGKDFGIAARFHPDCFR